MTRVTLTFSLLLAGVTVGCRDQGRPADRSTTPAIDPWSHAAPATPGTLVANDPWAGTADRWRTTIASADDVPSIAERRQLADEACPSVARPYFFRVEKEGKVSHLLGTRHLGVTLAKFPAIVGDSVRAARLVVLETAPDDTSEGPRAEIDLEEELGPTLWRRYRELVGSSLAKGHRRLRPAAALIAIHAVYEDLTAMLDREVEREARAANIPTGGLETSAFQDRVVAEFLDLRMLRATLTQIADRDELARTVREELAAYCAGTDDTPGLDAEERRELRAAGYTEAEIARWEEEMIFARNERWMPKLEALFGSGGVFVAVGADHLRGRRGVVAMLAEGGYTVTRIGS